MKATYWRAEVYRHDELYEIDFPNRATADEALADAAERMAIFSPREAAATNGGASEWFERDGLAINTGNTVEL